LSGHSFVFGRRPDIDHVPELAGDNWCNYFEQGKWKDFKNSYAEVLAKYDGFICCYPPIFSLLFIDTGKPVIVNIPIRYDYGVFDQPERLAELNEYLRKPNVYLTANSIYDKEYAEQKIGKHVEHIPSLCRYTGMQYKPTQNKFLYYCSTKLDGLPENVVRKEQELTAGYQWQRIGEYKGIIHFPYQCSTMSIFEQYSANIPLFVPSIDFMLRLYSGYERKVVLWQMSSYNLHGLAPVPVLNDPDNYTDQESVRHWLRKADYYDSEWMPHIQYFHNAHDLKRLLRQSDLQSISASMREANRWRIHKVLTKWDTLLERIGGSRYV
jgi:hypothetical protein